MTDLPQESKNQEAAIRKFLKDYLNKPKEKDAIRIILAETCGYYDGDRAYIFELSRDRKAASNTYEWCREGVEPQKDSLQNISTEGLECWINDLEEKGEFRISSLSEEFSSDSLTYRLLAPQGIESLVVAPLIVDGDIVGCLGVDNPRRRTEHTLLLSVVASACCSEITNKRLLDSNRALNDRMKIIESLSEIYTSVYYIDIAKDSFFELASIDSVHKHIGASGRAQEKLSYFCRNMTTPEFCDELLSFTDLSTLEKRLGGERMISRQFLCTLPNHSSGASPYWAQCSFIEGGRDSSGRLAQAVFVTRTIHDTKLKELEAAKQLRETNSELKRLLEAERQHTVIIDSLGSVFFALYYIDLEENSFQGIFSVDGKNRTYGEKDNARLRLKSVAESWVKEEYRAEMRVFTDFDTINERLGSSRIISQEYADTNGSWVRCSLISAEKDEQGRNIGVILGFRNISAEKVLQNTQTNLIQALSMPYQNVYAVNMDTGEALNYRMDRTISSRYGETFAAGDYEKNIGMYVQNDVYEEDRHLFDRIISVSEVERLLSDKLTYSFNYRVFRGDGIHYFECQLVKPSHESREFAAGFRNVDEEKKLENIRQKKIEDALAAVEKANKKLEYEMVIAGALSKDYPDVVLLDLTADTAATIKRRGIIIDEDKRVLRRSYNRTWEDYILKYVIEEDRESLRAAVSVSSVQAALRQSDEYLCSYRVVYDDSGVHYFQALFIRIYSSDSSEGQIIMGIRCVDAIVEEERRQRIALQAACEAAEAANKAKTDFLSNMSHDIRTPMNGIIGMTAIAATHIDDKERVQDSLQKIAQASKHMLSLINEVLDMSKIESGKVDLIEEEFNLSNLVDNLLTMTSSQIEAHKHKLSVNISGVEHEEVIGDSLRIQKVFTNLMSNAVKYTPDGGEIRFSITEKPSGQAKVGCYEFIFEDNGIGMSEEFLGQIFEPFARASDSRVNKIQGTGLGMPISRNIVRMMGGDIKVESKLNEGTKFTVTIYLKLRDSIKINREKFADLNVLVADDDNLSLESCCTILEDLGMKPDGVSSGEAAVRQVVTRHKESRDYFACIIDWKMPEMDGIETTRAIRKAVGNEVPIIIISAYDWSDIEPEARAAGANAFISKPLFRSRLAKAFSTLVGGEEPAPETEPAASLNNMELEGYRVLIAEDNDLNAEIATEILEMTGLAVERACDGAQAVDMMSASADGYYDLVFMDIQMPNMNGYDATRAIRAMDRSYCKQVPIVAMTANAFAEDVQAAKTVGMNEHIAKPLDLNVLAATLHKWLKPKS